MKRIRINPDKPASPAAPVEQLTPQPDPSIVDCARTITLHVGPSSYEMTWHTEVREITKGEDNRNAATSIAQTLNRETRPAGAPGKPYTVVGERSEG
jgi:hypothetical protein